MGAASTGEPSAFFASMLKEGKKNLRGRLWARAPPDLFVERSKKI